MLQKTVDSIAADTQTKWAKTGQNSREFANIAEDVLTSHRANIRSCKPTIVQWLASRFEDFPEQADQAAAGFGHPPLTLYTDPENQFSIEIYFWWSVKDVSIHDHDFSGAFMVLQGDSFQSRHRFDCERIIDGSIKTGSLHLEGTDFLPEGTITRIPHGSDFVHRVWHYSTPTITFIIRTTREPREEESTLFVYHRFFAHRAPDRTRQAAFLAKSLYLLEMLHRCQQKNESEELARKLILECGPYIAVNAAKSIYDLRLDREQNIKELLRSKADSGEPWFSHVLNTLESETNLRVFAWDYIVDYEQRMFASLLCTMNTRSEMEKQLARILPSEAFGTWANRVLTDMIESNKIGVKMPRDALAFLGLLLHRGSSNGSVSEASIAASSLGESPATQRLNIRNSIAKFTTLEPFDGLFK